MTRIFEPNATAKILVVGDVILDRYVHGDTSRISPEAPVPVVRVTRTEERPGGAANVAFNISSLGLGCCLVGITGQDESAAWLNNYLTALGIECAFSEQSGFPTITKLRVLSQHQQLLRLDYEVPVTEVDASHINDVFKSHLDECQVIVLSDYAKGSLTEVPELIRLAAAKNRFIMIDPKGNDFSRYRGASLLTPNFKEFKTIVGDCADEDMIKEKAQNLCNSLNLEALLITRGEHGMTLVQKDQPAHHLTADAREVYDVTGAGDTVIAAMASAIASGYGLMDAMLFANKAAGLVVGKLGAASVSADELNHVLMPHQHGKIFSEPQLTDLLEKARQQNKVIVMTNGCFDLLHSGHVGYLSKARELGDMLVVAVNDDDSVRGLKGGHRPINSLDKRMNVLAGLEAVDYIIPFSEDTPERLIRELKPDVLVKGGDYQISEIAGAEFVQNNGGEVHLIPLEAGCSTSAIIEAIKTQGLE